MVCERCAQNFGVHEEPVYYGAYPYHKECAPESEEEYQQMLEDNSKLPTEDHHLPRGKK